MQHGENVCILVVRGILKWECEIKASFTPISSVQIFI